MIEVNDGTRMSLFVARPPSARKAPVLLVLQEAFGVNGHIQDVACRFASEGYLAASPEFFHRTAPQGWTAPYDGFGEAMPHLQALNPGTLEADLRATVEFLKTDAQADVSRMGSIGYCMGGRASFLANSVFPLRAAVSYYGGRIAPDLLPLASKQHGPLLLFWGGKDGHIGPAQSRAVNDALRAAGKTFVDVEFGDAGHGFFNDQRESFHPASARQAWKLTLQFLAENLQEGTR